jgi:hypothetical protein
MESTVLSIVYGFFLLGMPGGMHGFYPYLIMVVWQCQRSRLPDGALWELQKNPVYVTI